MCMYVCVCILRDVHVVIVNQNDTNVYCTYIYMTVHVIHFTLLELAILELAKNPKFQSTFQRKMKEFNLKAPYERYNLDCVYVYYIHTYHSLGFFSWYKKCIEIYI